ncbi:hypothetical protein KJ059_15380 [Myxococcota bacterium]|nr:hypothetical protein [Myxococcota bacterium]MCZ7617097.1 hypothetical protein [Myxococcota bacterium]
MGTSDVFLEAVAPSASFDVDSSAPGSTTGLRVVFHIPQGVREVHEAVFVAPAAFGFLGFDALGAGAPIGKWEFDFALPDGVFDDPANRTLDHFALDADSAFSDSDASGGLTATDPTVSHSLGLAGEHVFTISLPAGGDGDPGSCLSRFPTDIRYTLFDGILVNPDSAGPYTVAIEATSIDLDTGGASDGFGPDEPLLFTKDVIVQVPEPAAATLSAAALASVLLLRRRQHARRR